MKMIDRSVHLWKKIVGRIAASCEMNWWLLRYARDLRTVRVLKNRGPIDTPTLIRLRFFGHPILVRCGTTDVWTVWDLLYAGEYSPLRAIPRKVVVDCGANIGMYLLSLLKEAPHDVTHYVGVEPDQASFELLQRQVALCGVQSKSSLVNAAVFDRDAVLKFDDGRQRHWENRLSPTGKKHVQAVTICTLLDSVGVQECDLLKVDIEGAEKELFASINPWKDRVKAIVCELHDDVNYAWFASQMKAAGFNPYPAGELFRRLPGAIRADLDH
jgi:FkbM family methyltransferase